jgi:hypothetical protein
MNRSNTNKRLLLAAFAAVLSFNFNALAYEKPIFEEGIQNAPIRNPDTSYTAMLVTELVTLKTNYCLVDQTLTARIAAAEKQAQNGYAERISQVKNIEVLQTRKIKTLEAIREVQNLLGWDNQDTISCENYLKSSQQIK